MAATTPAPPPDGLFHGVERAAATQFLDRLTPQDAEAGAVLFRERDPGDTLYIVQAGTVSLRCDTDGQEVVELARVPAGDVFGELSVLSPAPRTATAVAVTPVRVLLLTRRAFHGQLSAREPAAEALLRAITRRTCSRLRQSDARIALLQDALRGASPQDLVTRIQQVVSFDPPSSSDEDSWSAQLTSYLQSADG